MPSRGRNVGDYALGALLGRGATSEVYAGEHVEGGAPVAIKRLLDDHARPDELFAEAARIQAIRHPNVVQVIAFGHDDGCYLVMERVDGEHLGARLARTGQLDEAEARRLGAAIADGMQAAHDRGIVHRDLKPANVMLGGGEPKIVDFGIARHLGAQSAVQTGRRVGTPAYMAPEQLTGGLIAPCVDVWALGVILFELVTGRLPFEGYDDGRCPQLFETAPRVAKVALVSAAYDALVARCLQREPGMRPASMAEIASALRGELDAERITQDAGALAIEPPPGPSASTQRVIWAISLGLVGTLVLGSIVGLLMFRVGTPAALPDAAAAAMPPQLDAGIPDAAPHVLEIDAAPAPPPPKKKPPRHRIPPKSKTPPPKKPPPRETLD